MCNLFHSTIGRATGQFLALTAVCAGVLAAIFWEIRVRKSSCGETSVVEFAQMALLAGVALGGAAAAARTPRFRGGLVLVAGFFLCLVVRENDYWLDRVCHGFWFPVALAAAAAACVLAWRWRKGVLPCFAEICRMETLPYLLLGLVVLLLFSRLFGSKELWKTVYSEATVRTIKNVAEESLELLADALLAFWAVLTFPKLARTGREASHA